MAWRERGRFPCFRGDLSEKTKLMAPKSSKSRSKSSSRAEKSEGDASAAQVEPVAADATATNEDEVKSRSRGRSSSRATKNSSSGSDILQTSLPASAASAHHGPHYEFGGPVGAFCTCFAFHEFRTEHRFKF